jgi:hypothetical protein
MTALAISVLTLPFRQYHHVSRSIQNLFVHGIREADGRSMSKSTRNDNARPPAGRCVDSIALISNLY